MGQSSRTRHLWQNDVESGKIAVAYIVEFGGLVDPLWVMVQMDVAGDDRSFVS